MIVNCPRCSKAYLLTPEILTSPQVMNDRTPPTVGWWLSCGACSHAWWCSVPPAEKGPEIKSLSPAIEKTFPRDPFSYPKKTRWLSFVSASIVLLSLVGVGYLYKQPLLLLWGKVFDTERVVLQPFVLQNVSYNLVPSASPDDDSQTLIVTGQILNPNPILLDTPVLRISVWSDCKDNPAAPNTGGDCLYLEWVYKPNIAKIGNGTSLQFETRYSVSASVKRVDVAIP